MIAISPRSLIPHPQNQAIYGHEDLSELEASIREHGCLEAIVVTPEYVVVSGHRRLRVALDLGLPEVPIRIQEFDSDSAVLEALLLANLYREKTKLQRHNEGEAWEQIEREKSRARMLAGKAIDPVETISTGYTQGKTRDAVGARLGISGKSYEQEKEVVSIIRNAPEPIASALERIFDQSTKVALEVGRLKTEKAVEVAERIQAGASAKEAWKDVQKEQRNTEKEATRQIQMAVGKVANPLDNVHLHHADFTRWWQHNLDPQSIDIILTDPPYHERYLYLWEHLAEMAATVLKPNGLLIAYSGQSFLPQVFTSVGKHLNYVWTVATYHNRGYSQIWKTQILNAWKPIIVWTNGDYQPHAWITDFIKEGEKEKDLHDWAQPLGEAKHLIQLFTQQNQTLLDPMMGSGTIPLAAIQCGNLNVIGIEIEQENFLVAKGRIHDGHLSE